MKTLFVTGSGTAVGKTLVARLIITALRKRGVTVEALKPIVTGYDARAPESSDTALLLDALGLEVELAQLEHVSPWRYRAPLSPDMAAEREGCPIEFTELVALCLDSRRDAMTIIEGVGGVMAPIDERHTVLDWIEALACPVVLVTGSYLGTISHTLTALAVLSARRVPVRGIVISESIDQPAPLAATARAIGNHIDALPVVQLPRLTDIAQAPDLLGVLSLDLPEA